ncbi:hypothetical protein [Mixta calida]|uniref:hypothetical protein n=1 Tax=Mixta calida TaxID=665913 RepID=UPI0028AE360F|nr:hypothetical protein [Mixta calida]
MAIFDIEKDELLRLTDNQLEELVARLAEAEVAKHGHSPAYVCWSGSINASDEGIDIHVKVPADELHTGFLLRPNTILQAKKHSMPKSAIIKEMVFKGKLSATISEQVTKGGSYIIVSLGDDCSPPMKRERIKAMRDIVEAVPNNGNIYLDFFDRSKLVQWLRQHPSIMLWVKGKLGQGYSGWQPYGLWSNPPRGVDDTLISAPGISIRLPIGKGEKLGIADAIDPMRNLIRSTNKAIRITGLSGVGKTRIVQALFDETIGANALDRTIAVYVDISVNPEPSAAGMLDRLIIEDRRAILILDNCPSDLHSLLAGKISSAGTNLSLITVEYDISDNKPQTTEVIYIEAIGPEVAKQLLFRRFPEISRYNAQRIAEFANGNARVALAIAEQVEKGESLAQLSDEQLFNRLFEQRNPDENLREQAEILSLVYSFSDQSFKDGPSELEILGSIMGHSQNQLRRSVSKLLKRHIVQKRAHWRAILPHVIANRLAESALNNFTAEQLRDTFENIGNPRLLMSFAHRLGLLHDHPVAKEIVKAWLQPDGLLGQITELDDISVRILDYIGPVVPEVLLDRIEAKLTASNFKNMESRYDQRRKTIINLLQALAYEPSAFDRCVRLLINLADDEAQNNREDTIRNKLVKFFQAYLSGTHASLDQRIVIMNDCLSSDKAIRVSLGLRMLSTALGGPNWTGFVRNEFGARPRDYGFQPNYDELIKWRCVFIDLAVQLGNSGVPSLQYPARLILADNFRGLWSQEGMRDKLINAARQLNTYQPWNEGWQAVRSTIYFDYTKRKDKDSFKLLPPRLAELDKELEPNDLIHKVLTFVLSKGHSYWILDDDFDHDALDKYQQARERLEAKAIMLGHDFAASTHKIHELGPALFSGIGRPYRAAFGKGLAKGTHDLRDSWRQLTEQLKQLADNHKDMTVIGGFIEECDSINPVLAQQLLDQSVQHPDLRHVLVNLHPWREFTETDLNRCITILDDPDISAEMYGPILWSDNYNNLPVDRILSLAKHLLSKPNGDNVVLEALSMKLHGKERTLDSLGADFRLVGLQAAIQTIQKDSSNFNGDIDYALQVVVGAALPFDGNESEKLEWLDAIFAVVDKNYGYIYKFEESIRITASLMPEAFLHRVFEGTEEQQHLRQFFICYDGLRRSPLEKIDVAILIAWCRDKSDICVWPIIAAGIAPWTSEGDQKAITISESAIKLLEACPEPRAVLKVFTEYVARPPVSRSRADLMQLKADAIGKLLQHENKHISEAARSIFAELTQFIDAQKINEQQNDIEREQRFE